MGRFPTSCSSNNHLRKGPWTAEEDQLLMDYIQKNGHGSWRVLAKNSGLNRCGKSCRLRWINYLNPEIKRGKFSEEEERIIINLHSTLGNKWSKIAGHLPGRTDNEIKNFWNSHVKKKLLNPSTQQISHLHNLLNLSQLFSSSTLNNPWNNNAAIRPLINHFATTQLMQNIMQTMHKFHVPSIEENINLLQNHYLPPQFNQPMNPSQEEFIKYLNPNIFPSNNVYGIANSLIASSEGGGTGQSGGPMHIGSSCNTRLPFYVVDNLTGSASTSQTQSENWVSTLDHSSIANQLVNMQQADDHVALSSNPNSDIFEEWGKLVDDETNSAIWRDIVEWNQEAT